MTLAITTQGKGKATATARLTPVNTAMGGVCCTLNTRYEAMAEPSDILTLAHYPKTVVMIEYE